MSASETPASIESTLGQDPPCSLASVPENAPHPRPATLPEGGSEEGWAQQPVAVPPETLYQRHTTSRVAPAPQRAHPWSFRTQDVYDFIEKSDAYATRKADELAARLAEKKRQAAFSTAATLGSRSSASDQDEDSTAQTCLASSSTQHAAASRYGPPVSVETEMASTTAQYSTHESGATDTTSISTIQNRSAQRVAVPTGGASTSALASARQPPVVDRSEPFRQRMDPVRPRKGYYVDYAPASVKRPAVCYGAESPSTGSSFSFANPTSANQVLTSQGAGLGVHHLTRRLSEDGGSTEPEEVSPASMADVLPQDNFERRQPQNDDDEEAQSQE